MLDPFRDTCLPAFSQRLSHNKKYFTYFTQFIPHLVKNNDLRSFKLLYTLCMLEETSSLVWRRVAQQLGLVRDQSSAQPDVFDPSRLPSFLCGVSLSYLEALASSLHSIPGASDLSTGDVMQQILLPAIPKLGKGNR